MKIASAMNALFGWHIELLRPTFEKPIPPHGVDASRARPSLIGLSAGDQAFAPDAGLSTGARPSDRSNNRQESRKPLICNGTGGLHNKDYARHGRSIQGDPPGGICGRHPPAFEDSARADQTHPNGAAR
jgi:hypothetical protein